ncbi:MAG TPA: DUF3999 family protein [Ramlibacter sp.]|nr:DUF3999 family protein [Ramlibacter sp.]
MMALPALVRCTAVASVLAGGAALCHAQVPAPSEFAWRAPLTLPAGTAMARVDLSAQALLQLQASDASDVRIFNAAGESVAFARIALAAEPPARTKRHEAMPLHSAAPESGRPKGSVQVRIDGPGGERLVWVQTDGGRPAGATQLKSALFAMKDEKRPLAAIDVHATLPANTPVAIRASSSADLAQWTPLAVRGRLYRFEGEGAPVNMTLEFEQPTRLEGRYLRLDWTGQDGVMVSGMTGVVSPAAQAPKHVRAELAAPQAASEGAVTIATGFLTPMAGLHLSTSRDNALLPVRILGRSEASQPWRLLAQTVVYRLAAPDLPATNPSVALNGASARWLRIESTHGADLGAAGLQASAEFAPVQIVFLATGPGPFQLAAGRAATPAAALPIGMITSALGGRKLEDLPLATLGPSVLRAPAEASWLGQLWPGLAPGKTAILWGVLLVGVMLLGAVAWSLMRQLKTSPPPPSA